MQAVTSQSKIPVIKHDKGVCHIYVDREADLQMAQNVCFNAKVQRPGTGNAMEALLGHEHIAPIFLPAIGKTLHEAGVEIRGCPKTVSLIPNAKRATDGDWGKEFLELILAVKVVDDMDAAMQHIVNYGGVRMNGFIRRHHIRYPETRSHPSLCQPTRLTSCPLAFR